MEVTPLDSGGDVVVPVVEAADVEADYLSLQAPTQGTTVRVTDSALSEQRLQSIRQGSLFAISNTFGWAVAAGNENGFSLFSLDSLRSTYASAETHSSPTVAPRLVVSTPAPVSHLAFAMSDKIVLAGSVDGSVAAWRLKSLVEGNAAPQCQFASVGSPIVSLHPCPAPSSPLVFVLTANGTLPLLSLATSTTLSILPTAPTPVTAACWSVKGKQLAVGLGGGEIRQYSPEDGSVKASIPPPSALAQLGGTWDVRALEWLENNVFLVTFGRPISPMGGDPAHEDEIYVATRKADKSIEWTSFQDPAPAFGMMGRPGRRWTGRFRNWTPFNHLLFIANATSTDVGVVALLSSAATWSSLALSDASRPSLPLGPSGEDVCPLGLDLDTCNPDVSKGPALWIYTSQGVLVCWQLTNEHDEAPSAYPGLKRALDVVTQEDLADSETSAAASVQSGPTDGSASAMSITPAVTPKPSPFAVSAAPTAFGGSSPFGAPAASVAPAFGAAPAFGQSSFGAPAAFGASAFGAASKPAPSPSAFSATPSTPNAFSSAASSGNAFAAFGSGTGASGGFAGFGSTKPATAAGTGASPFGSGSAFGSSAPASTSSTVPAFGKSAFGATSTAPAASTTTSSSGGFAGFGSAATSAGSSFGSVAGQSKTPAASSTGASPFGSGVAFGAPAFGKTSFGAAPATPSATTTAPTAGGFAGFGSSTSTGASGFGAFSGGNAFASVPTGASPFSSGGSAFGAVPATVSATPAAPAVKSAFGAGGSAFGAGGSAFGAGGVSKFASPSASPSTVKPTFTARNDADSDDEEVDDDMDAGGRVDEPPDLEPTKTNLDLNESMKGAMGSQEKVAAAVAAADSAATDKPSTPAASAFSSGGSAFGFGGLGLGNTSTTPSASSAATPTPASISIFGSAAAASTTKPPTATPSLGFSFGTSSFSSPSISKPATGFSFGSAPATTAPTPAVTSKPQETKAKQAPEDQEPEVKKEPEESKLPPSSARSTPAASTEPVAAPLHSVAPSTKSLFGFASSPPKSPNSLAPSFGSRLDEAKKLDAQNADSGQDEYEGEDNDTFGDEGEVDDEGAGEDDEEYEDEDGDGDHGEEDSYDEEPEEDVDYGEEEEEREVRERGEQEESRKDIQPETDQPAAPPSPEDKKPEMPPAASSSLFSRLSPAPSPAASPAHAASSAAQPKPAFSFAPTQVSSSATSTPPTFSFATPVSSTASVDARSAPATEALKSPSSGFGTPAASTSASSETSASASSFGGFGSPVAAAAAAPPASKPAFSFAPSSSTPAASTTTASPATPTAAAASKPATGFFGFNPSAPKASSPLASPSSFLAPKGAAPTHSRPTSPLAFGSTVAPVTDSKTSPATSAPSPFALPAATASSGFSFGKPASSTASTSTTAPAPKPPAFAPATPKQSASSPAPQSKPSPAPAPSTPNGGKMGQSLASTTTPKLGSQLVSTKEPSVNETGMSGEFLKAYLRVEKDFEILRDNAAIFKSFVKDIGQPCQTADEPTNFDDRYWSLGDLPRLREQTQKVEPAVRALAGEAQKQKRQAAELQSLLLKAETKREEAARFIRARSDPEFAKMVRVRQLGPEQVENQKKIRHSIETVRTRIEQLEDHLASLKDRVMEARLGRSAFKAPSLDSVNRAVRNITVAITEKTFELDDLSLRLDTLRLQPAGNALVASARGRRSSPSIDDTLSSSILRGSPSSKALAPKLHPDVVASAKAALNAERSSAVFKDAMLSHRSSPLLNKSACSSESKSASKRPTDLGDLQLAFANGPITGDRLPLPRRPPPPPPALLSPPSPASSAPQARQGFSNGVGSSGQSPVPTPPPPSWSLPAASPAFVSSSPQASPQSNGNTSNPPPLMFKAPISFSFASPPTAPAASATSTGGRGSGSRGSTRTHSSAVQLRGASPGGEGSTPKAATTFDWGPLPNAPAARPTGFVPFSSLAPTSSEVGVGGPDDSEDEDAGKQQDEEWDEDGDDFEEEEEEEEEEGLDSIQEGDEED